MPAAVPRTSTMALTNVTMPYVLELAEKGFERAINENPELTRGLNVLDGDIVYEPVASSLGLPFRSPN